MRARFKIEKPEDIEATVTITMKLSDWEALRDQLKDSWPSWKLTAVINDLLSQGGKIFWAAEPEEEA